MNYSEGRFICTLKYKYCALFPKRSILRCKYYENNVLIMKEFNDLQLNDKVVVVRNCAGKTRRIVGYVERLTPASIYVSGVRFRKKDGRRVGESLFSYTYIEVASEEVIENVEKEMKCRKIASYLQGYSFSKLSLEKLQMIMKIINE